MNSSADQKQHSEYKENLELLMEIPFFAGLQLEALKLIAYLATRETYEAGEYLFHQEEPDDNAFYILEGTASLLVDSAPGEIVTTFAGGDFIGGLALVGDMKRLFSLRVEERVVTMRITREKFQKTVEQFPAITNKILESIVDMVYRWEFRFLREHAEHCPDCRKGIGVSLL